MGRSKKKRRPGGGEKHKGEKVGESERERVKERDEHKMYLP
jgi:hypothetical protein